MRPSHDEINGLLAAVALDAASADEMIAVEAHVRACAQCRRELADMRAGAGLLALAPDEMDPPPALRDSIMEAVRAEGGIATSTERTPAPATERRRPSWWRSLMSPWPATAVALAALAAALLVWNVALQTDDHGPAPVLSATVAGTAAAPGMSGRMTYVADADALVVHLSGLDPLPADEAYQLWTIADGTPRSAGVFEPDATGTATVVATGVSGADTIGLTAQPRTRTAAPEGALMMAASLPA